MLDEAAAVLPLQKLIRPYVLRRLKSEVEKALPRKEEVLLEVELSSVQKQYYRAIFEKNRSLLGTYKVRYTYKLYIIMHTTVYCLICLIISLVSL